MRVKDFKVEDYYYPSRRFQLLFYQVSHNEMIIRSHKNDTFIGVNHEHTIDIYFGDVIYMEIPRNLNGIIFRKPNDDDVKYLNTKIEKEITEDKIVLFSILNDASLFTLKGTICA